MQHSYVKFRPEFGFFPTRKMHFSDLGILNFFPVVRALKEDQELQPLVREFKFLCHHADRRRNSISFLKCQLIRPGKECDWCLSHPPLDCPAYRFEKGVGGFSFDPMPSEDHPDHFMTYLEMINLKKYDYQHDLFGIGKCSICPNWWFSSPTEMKRHKKLAHPRISIKNILKKSDDEDLSLIHI